MGRETLTTERTAVARAMLVTAVRSIFNVYKKCGELVKEEKKMISAKGKIEKAVTSATLIEIMACN